MRHSEVNTVQAIYVLWRHRLSISIWPIVNDECTPYYRSIHYRIYYPSHAL